MLILSLPTGQISSTSVTRITPNDALAGGVVCPNLYPVEVTCVGVEVNFLQWQRNGISIGAFTSASNKGDFLPIGALTLFLDSITTRNSMANMTSRLVGNTSNFISSDRITCIQGINMEDMMSH